MSSLYRKYRPSKFAELVGQDHIRSSIEAMIQSGQIGHAFLFSGPRGTGKTTLARLLAKSVNCVGERDGVEACGKCAICKEIAANRLIDINEIDAASNRGIDEIRELKGKISFAPVMAKYKIYIIDEVHMLTKEAFNALLKTLEEPPAHAIFILATTELHKLPQTIISRCLRYQFHLAPQDQTAKMIGRIAKKEGIKLEDAAIEVLASRAEGSYRDALTLLGNISNQGPVSEAKLRELIGMPSDEVVGSVERALKEGNVKLMTSTVKSFLSEGGDLVVLTRNVANNCREQIFSGENEASVGYHGILLERLLVCLAKARHSSDATSLLAAQLVNLTLRAKNQNQSSVQARVEAIVEKVTDITDISTSREEIQITQPVDSVNATPVRADDTTDFWTSFLMEVKENNHALYAIVRSANFGGLTDEKLTISVKFRFYSERLFEPKNRIIIEKAASKVAGKPIKIECLVEAGVEVKVNKEDDLMSAVVDVFEIDEN